MSLVTFFRIIEYTMKTEAIIFLFLILLLGLVLCSFLGGQEGFTGNFSGGIQVKNPATSSGASTASRTQYNTYNHFTKSSSQLTTGTIFYGKNGTTATVVGNPDGTQSLKIILPGTTKPIVFSPNKPSKESYTNYSATVTTYYGPNGAKATIVTTKNGQQAIKVTTGAGTYYYYASGTKMTSTQYFGSTGTALQKAPYSMAYNKVTKPQGNPAFLVGATQNTDYYNTLPHGVPKNQIPPGQEDLYILKSQVVPPVCPACPVSNITVPRQESCPPCPACARCPEPAFECKKVPNYNAINNDYLPAPVLNDFSQFGM